MYKDQASRKRLLLRKISDLVEEDDGQGVVMTSVRSLPLLRSSFATYELQEYFNRVLQQSVSSVAAEFSDLDGMTWESPEARQALQEWVRLPP